MGVVALVAGAGYVAVESSPWPSALAMRFIMDSGGEELSEALEKHVPAGITSRRNERYDAADQDAILDVHYPSAVDHTERMLPTILWVHGGGFLSGSKDHIANYARIVAAHGYAVVGVNYSLAPRVRYPTPVGQVNKALAFLRQDAKRLHLDMSRLVIAGDSAGAQLAAQLAIIVGAPAYAKAMAIVPAVERASVIGTILYCGMFDLRLARRNGLLGLASRTVGWSYFGVKDYLNYPRIAELSVIDHMTPDFPPLFISAGNADPLLPHSLAMADAAARSGVAVDRLFFADDQRPGLPHEYQFNLDNEAGRLALERMLKFLAALAPDRSQLKPLPR